MTLPTNVNDWTHLIIDSYLDSSSYALDLTVGNGNDTQALAKRAKYVFGFDIQKKAIDNTLAKLESLGLEKKVRVFHACHSEVLSHIKQEIDLVVMNLGYLPKGDKSIVTKWATTKPAIEKGLFLLKKNGLFLISLYKGHPGAEEEASQLPIFISSLDQKKYGVNHIEFPNQKNQPPELFVIERIGQ